MYCEQTSFTRVGVATLNQWAMDFEHNKNNIIKSIKFAKERGCKYRVGPELEICGYSCEDHFLENDTVNHSWEVLYDILNSDLTDGLIVDLGMPVIHKNVFYNCRIICYDREVKLIRPKKYLADDGNYRESRWFTPWQKTDLEEFTLPEIFQKIKNQRTTQFGVAIIKTHDTEIGLEICEELWVPQPTSTQQALDGAEIIVNSSSSHFEINKIHRRNDLIKDITYRNGAAYLFSNQRGCDGNRIFFDGFSLIACNGLIYETSQFGSLSEVDVITHDLDLAEVRNHRINLKARSQQAAKQNVFPRVTIATNMSTIKYLLNIPTPRKFVNLSESQQVADTIAAYLWDYLRRSDASGYFLPLSGGCDSACSAILVYHMCDRVFQTLSQPSDKFGTYEQVLSDLRRIVNEPSFFPKSTQEIVHLVFSTAYLKNSNSSQETQQMSRDIAKEINSQHYEMNFDEIFDSFRNCIKPVFHQEPKFPSEGGQDFREDLALQNIQARTRMVLSYVLAQLTPWNNGKKGFYLVLGSSNLDESLRGYVTKYDCSSADLNPLGSLTKNDLRRVIKYISQLNHFVHVPKVTEQGATPELRPVSDSGNTQNSIEEMGLNFDELETFGKLRKIHRLGPVSMFRRLLPMWKHLKPEAIAEKVKKFFRYYAINRHKQVVQTPAIHAEGHSNDDNRYDLRQFLYNWRWPFQFSKIDQVIKEKAIYDQEQIKVQSENEKL